MLMNAKLHDALCVAVIALLGLFLGAVRSNEVMITSENKVLAFDQTELTIGTFEFFLLNSFGNCIFIDAPISSLTVPLLSLSGGTY